MGTNGKNRPYGELGKQLYVDALERGELAARRNGHILGMWQQVDERLHASFARRAGRWFEWPDQRTKSVGVPVVGH